MVIKCKYDEWEGFDVKSVNIDHIFDCSPSDTTTPFSENLKQSLILEGLNNPLILVPTTPKALTKRLSNVNHALDIPENKAILLALFGGSSRLAILKEMGVSFVDCIILPYNNFSDIQKLQRIQRQSHKDLYGRMN